MASQLDMLSWNQGTPCLGRIGQPHATNAFRGSSNNLCWLPCVSITSCNWWNETPNSIPIITSASYLDTVPLHYGGSHKKATKTLGQDYFAQLSSWEHVQGKSIESRVIIQHQIHHYWSVHPNKIHFDHLFERHASHVDWSNFARQSLASWGRVLHSTLWIAFGRRWTR